MDKIRKEMRDGALMCLPDEEMSMMLKEFHFEMMYQKLKSGQLDRDEHDRMHTNGLLEIDPEAYCQGKTLNNLTYPTKDEVEDVLRVRCDAVTSNWVLLNKIILAYEDTIRKRWLKKTKKSKEALLLQALPAISKAHNPGLKAWMNVGGTRRDNDLGLIPREALLLPLLNIEDLSQPKTLLLLLNERGRNPPELFMGNDALPIPFARNTIALKEINLP